jgi:uncharacterized protein (TIGR00369 family)
MRQSSVAWHGGCIACGDQNPRGLRLDFKPTQDGRIEAAFACETAFKGYDDRLHGGVIAMVLDAAMTHCLFARGLAGVTAELVVRFRHPVEVGTPARVLAWVEKQTRRLHVIRSEIVQDGMVKASAIGKLMDAKPYRHSTKERGDAP